MRASMSTVSMAVGALFLLAEAPGQAVYASPTTHDAVRRQSSNGGSNGGYTAPTQGGGSMLTRISPSSDLGEPLNVIISGESDAQVLTPAGASEYFESLFFSPGDCLGISAGNPQQADLGDGSGYVNQTDVLRFNYYQGDGGTCLESIQGGNHLRYWAQNGSSANTGALFIAASVEYPATQSHLIVPNGYDLGRDWLTGNATNATGTTSPGGFHYTATRSQVNLLQNVDMSTINHGIAVDGVVHVLTVRVTQTGQQGANRTTKGDTHSQSGAVCAGAVSSMTLIIMTTLPPLLTAAWLVFV